MDGRARSAQGGLRGRISVAGLASLCAALGCAPSDGAADDVCAPTGSVQPQSIGDVVQMLNGLPKPIDLPCALTQIPGSLALYANVSTLSLQPAVGQRSPRIFIFLGPLIASVVPEGSGRNSLELGERRGEARSLKGEIQFPVTAALSPSAPFDHALFDDTVTTCAFCHGQETPAPDISFARAFDSQALRPDPFSQVGIDLLRAEREACDRAAEPYRCAMLKALLDRDALTPADFPPTFATF